MKEYAWQHTSVGINRGDNKLKTSYSSLDDILLSVYSSAENHDIVHLTKITEETAKTKPLKPFDTDKIVCVKLTGVSEEELKESLERLGLKNLNVTTKN